MGPLVFPAEGISRTAAKCRILSPLRCVKVSEAEADGVSTDRSAKSREGARRIPYLSAEDAEGRGEQQGRIGFSVRRRSRISRTLLAQIAVRADGNEPQTPEHVEAWRRRCRYDHLKICLSTYIFMHELMQYRKKLNLRKRAAPLLGPPCLVQFHCCAAKWPFAYSVGHPSGISLAASASSIAAAASSVTHPLQMSDLLFSHHRAASLLVAPLFAFCQRATSL